MTLALAAIWKAISSFFAALWAFITSPMGGIVGFGAALLIGVIAVNQWVAINGISFSLPLVGQIYLESGYKHDIQTITDKYNADEKAINDPVTGWSARLNQCHLNTQNLEGELGVQNTHITALQDAGNKITSQYQALLGTLGKKVDKASQAAAAILAQSKPIKGEDECKAAEGIIQGNIQ